MKDIELEYFRCFDHLQVALFPKVNLFIGDNASGKTSILAACRYALSSFFSGFSTEYTKWISPSSNDFRSVCSLNNEEEDIPLKIHFHANTEMLPDLYEVEPQVYNNLQYEHVIQKNSRKNSRAMTSGLRDLKKYGAALLTACKGAGLQNKAESHYYELPLFAYFATEDIHTPQKKISISPFLKYYQKRSFGYFECLNEHGLYNFWLKRLRVLKEGKKNLEEIEVVRNAIRKALGEEGCGIISDMDIRTEQGKIYYIFTDGREVESSLLSDGYKRVISIVTDIAERCALLNYSVFGQDCGNETKGVVIIDEIDMHLHPTLQASIISGLRSAFPGIQFILSTHAPMVMSGVKNDKDCIVYKLSYSEENGYTTDAVNPYGMDMSGVTKTILNQFARPENVHVELEKLFNFIDQNEFSEARRHLELMRNEYGENLPELSEAETMINLSIIDDEADN